MKFTHFVLALRAAVLIAAAGFVAANARGYLLNRWGVSVAPSVYGLGAFAFVWIILWLSTRKLLRELKVNVISRKLPGIANQQETREDYAETVHKYPALLGYLLAAVGVVFLALPYLSAEPGKSIAPVTFVGCLVISFIIFVIDFYIVTYSVTITHDKILIRAFMTRREIAIADIANTDVVTTKNGPQVVVLLKNGKIVRFGRMLTDFTSLLETLTAKTSRRTGAPD